MYFPVGWPRVLRCVTGTQQIRQLVANRDKVLFAALTDTTLVLWFCKPSVPLVVHCRSGDSLKRFGVNTGVEWKPDSSMLCVSTECGYLLFYSVLTRDTPQESAYVQSDPPSASLRRDSAELFGKEKIPPLEIKLVEEVSVFDGVITRMACMSGTELAVCTSHSHLLRYRWDGTHNRDYALDLARIPFSIDQYVSKAVPLLEDNAFIVDLEYSPLICGYGITLNDGRAAYLTAPNLKFDPNQVQGIWAQGVDDATCVRINHKFRLIAVGRRNSQVDVLTIDEVSGGLETVHALRLRSRDFPGDPGAVVGLRWSADGRAVAVCWQHGGLSVWSTFGALLACSLAWDTGLPQPPLKVTALEWATEGYRLWMVRDAAALVQLDFVKSPLAVNPATSQQSRVYLQADDKLYINAEETPGCAGSYDSECRKQWLVVPLPPTYIATNWPLRYSAMDASGQHVCVAGSTGLAHYACAARRWKVFGNETQEKEFVVSGGLVWWRDYMVAGCYSIGSSQDEVRFYARDTRLDNKHCSRVRISSQVCSLSALHDQLVVLGADALVSIYALTAVDNAGLVEARCVQAVEVSALAHPTCVVSVELCRLGARAQADSLLLNASGRLMMVQRERAEPDSDDNTGYSCLPATVLASCVESAWHAGHGAETQLARALWLWCGALGARVWLPLLSPPHPDSSRHAFMAKRIMLPFHLDIYPLAVLFSEAILVGAENDTTVYTSDATSPFSLPFCVVNRTSQVYLQQVLRQLLRRNLGYQAWEIARSCSHLPYFPHALELLLHEVLEEEATSKEPLPDAQLPSVLEFVHEFPVYLQTVVQCARKTEIALWSYLFSAAGKPRDLFEECLRRRQLDTAASYLIVLQNLESACVSRQLAARLLDTALLTERWALARDLVRFLRAIDPPSAEKEQHSSAVQSQPALASVAPNAEHLSVILGGVTLAGTRGRSFSTDNTDQAATATAAVQRKKSVPAARRGSGDAGLSAGMEQLVERHARRLLAGGRLLALGRAAAALDIPLVTWLASERERAARVDNAVACLKRLHEDFAWPYPTADTPQSPPAPPPAHYAPQHVAGSLCTDSGYTSLALRETGGACATGSLGDESAADGGSVWGDGDERRYVSLVERLQSDRNERVERGSHASHVRLRYLLQLMTEAACVEWALLLAVVLRDAMAVLRTTNAARSADVSLEAVRRLRRALLDLCAWVDCECLGYKPFTDAVSNQVAFLTSVLSARERRVSVRPRASPATPPAQPDLPAPPRARTPPRPAPPPAHADQPAACAVA